MKLFSSSIILFILMLLLFGCTGINHGQNIPASEKETPELKETSGTTNPEEAGTFERNPFVWVVSSATVFYDSGGSDTISIDDVLEIRPDQTWSFSQQNGRWEIDVVEENDWKRWAMNDFGATIKMVLHGWNGEIGDGPIQEIGGRISSIWLVYRSGPPEIRSSGQVQIKFEAE